MATSTPSYPGFDAFNRVTDLPWTKTTSGDIAHLKYGYDLASNRTYRQDVKAGSSAHLDEAYAYDGMQGLGWMARGHYPTRSNLLLNGQDFTTCGWIKFNSISTAHDNGIWGKGNSGNNAYTQQEWVFVVSGGYLYWVMSNGTTNTIVDPSFYPVINTWYFFSAGYDATSAQGWCRIYDNGTVHSATHSGPGPTDRGNGFTIGRSMDNFLDGWIDAVGVWGRVLSTTELDALYNSNNGYDLQIHAKYTYLGLNTPVQVDYPQPQVNYDLATGSGANPYAGIDKYGRVVDNLWTQYATATTADEIKYGYDRNSNRIYRENALSKLQTTPKYFDELYSYDGLNRLTDMQRGQLTGSPPSGITNKNFEQAWALDPTGNWGGFQEDATGGGRWTLDQTRDSTNTNEISSITNASPVPAWAQPVYDHAGNMTTIPQPADMTAQFTATYDAWNRLVKLVDQATSQTVQENQYDGTTRRSIQKTYTSGSLTETRHYFYSDAWQVLEEQVVGATYTPDRQFVWGLRYIDDLILRYRSTTGTLSERLYALQDANWNVTALVDNLGAVQQRFAYSPYGAPLFLNPDFTSGSNTKDWETLYCGYRWDAVTGLYPVRWRILQSILGNWLTTDPVDLSHNSYEYSAASPINAVDPLGLFIIALPVRRKGSGEINEAATTSWKDSVINAFKDLCPCIKIAIDNDPTKFNTGTPNGAGHLGYRLTATWNTENFPTDDDLCDCFKRNCAGCTLIHDLLVATTYTVMQLVPSQFGNRAQFEPFTTSKVQGAVNIGGGVLSWHPTYRGVTTPETTLAHEMTHAWTFMNWGKAHPFASTVSDAYEPMVNGIGAPKMGEAYAVRVENEIGRQISQGYVVRLTYRSEGKDWSVPRVTTPFIARECEPDKWKEKIREFPWGEVKKSTK